MGIMPKTNEEWEAYRAAQKCSNQECEATAAGDQHEWGDIQCRFKRDWDDEADDYTFRNVGKQRYVNVHEVDRAYGGSEEGGWWFDTGTPVEAILCRDPDEAQTVLEERRERYRKLSEDAEYPLSSVCYRGGEFRVTWDYDIAAPYPAERPRYE